MDFLLWVIIGALLIFAILLVLIWLFIKSAVQRGVEDALRNSQGDTIFVVKQGILDALEELDIIQYRFYDEKGNPIELHKK